MYRTLINCQKGADRITSAFANQDIAGRTQHHLTATTLNDTTLASISQHQHTNSESMHNLSQNGSQAAACDLSINTLGILPYD